ncbi:hypothetical protein BKA56DRAFT_661135 [Ilyonectria sp. MPI-CAGE-AT-0026]|nr:hypothetical protein BKA56DRAFT_661135 [Ilyonectria sp. MPI-CAGE-AT-0026]
MAQTVVDIAQLLHVRDIRSPIGGEHPGRADLVDRASGGGSAVGVLVTGFTMDTHWCPRLVPLDAYIEPLAQRCRHFSNIYIVHFPRPPSRALWVGRLVLFVPSPTPTARLVPFQTLIDLADVNIFEEEGFYTSTIDVEPIRTHIHAYLTREERELYTLDTFFFADGRFSAAQSAGRHARDQRPGPQFVELKLDSDPARAGLTLAPARHPLAPVSSSHTRKGIRNHGSPDDGQGCTAISP